VTIVCPNLAKKVLAGESHYESKKGGCSIQIFSEFNSPSTQHRRFTKNRRKCCLKAWAGSLGLQSADPCACNHTGGGKVSHSWPSDQKSTLPGRLQAIEGYSGMDSVVCIPQGQVFLISQGIVK